MILGLDISTSIIGITIIDNDGKIVKTDALDLRNKNHYPDIYAKYQKVFQTIRHLRHESWYEGASKFSHVFIEQSLQMFRSGFSSAKTLSASSARKSCGITIKKGTKAKEQVVKFLLDNEPKFTVEYTKSGNLKPKYYDIADSIVIAKAGYEICQSRKK